MREARLRGDVGERAVAIVVEQIARRTRVARLRIEAAAVHEEDVEPAVVVVVEERGTAAHFLEDELLVGRTAGDVDGARESRRGGDVGEHDGLLRVQREVPGPRDRGGARASKCLQERAPRSAPGMDGPLSHVRFPLRDASSPARCSRVRASGTPRALSGCRPSGQAADRRQPGRSSTTMRGG